MPSHTVAIIGTAGRREDGAKMSAALFDACALEVGRYLHAHELWPENVVLRSGGAAWMDHVAVRLFLDGLDGTGPQFAGLTLCLPCTFVQSTHQFRDTGVRDWRTNPGGTANYYHRQFSAALGRDTLAEVGDALQRGAFAAYAHGLHQRNSLTGACDHLLAFTWGEGDVPKDGGTLDTWQHSRAAVKTHVSLGYIEARYGVPRPPLVDLD